MKAFLTEWLIMHGTGWGPWHAGIAPNTCIAAHLQNYMDQRAHIGGTYLQHDYKLTPKGLEYLKNG